MHNIQEYERCADFIPFFAGTQRVFRVELNLTPKICYVLSDVFCFPIGCISGDWMN